MNDPFQVLGISDTATADEIKQAYRRMAKLYHPNVNPGDPAAEAKMQQINAAYARAIQIMRDEKADQGFGPFANRQRPFDQDGQAAPQNENAQAGRQWGPFAANQQPFTDPELQEVANCLRMGRYQEAMNILNRMPEHNAAWHALFALTNMGMGNRIAALNSARQAVEMEPNNPEYQQLLHQLEHGGNQYQPAGRFNTTLAMLCSNPCLSCCIINAAINCCCSGTGAAGREC